MFERAGRTESTSGKYIRDDRPIPPPPPSTLSLPLTLRSFRFPWNCAPAPSVTPTCCGRQGFFSPELHLHPPPCRSPSPSLPLSVAVSLYDKAWPLRHSRRKHCACFHQSPLWQRQMVQSSTFTSIPAGMIVVPAKQFGPVALGREGGRGLGQENRR